MTPIIYGIKQILIGYDEFLIKCNSCEKHSWGEILVTSKYYHFYGTPLFPAEKEANISCKSCELKRYGVPFDKDLITNFEEVKDNFKHPWFTYLGVGAVCLLVAVIIVVRILSA